MYIPEYITGFFTSYSLLLIVNICFAVSIVFLERKNPASTLAWLMVLFLLPGVGILLYLIFSQNITRQKVSRFSDYEQKLMRTTLSEQIQSINEGTFTFTGYSAEKWKDMIHLGNMCDAYYTQDNTVDIFTDGPAMFAAMLQDIQNAKSYINVLYFIIKDDRMGRIFIDALTERAQSGITVRLLLDALGCGQITQKRLAAFKQAGGKYAYFFPSRLKYINLKLNYRNHRKIVVIDGVIGYTGGFNVGDSYVGRHKKFGHWRDTHLKLTGNCVYDLNTRFWLDWRFSSREYIDLSAPAIPDMVCSGLSGLQIISSGPDSKREEIKYGYLKLISSAKRNIYMQTPYFVPDSSIIEALKGAALSGVDVRIMIPCQPDHIFVYWATYSYIGELLQYGVKAYIYDDGFLHAKMICVDSEIVSVGSANFDIRSFKLNFETNAFIYDDRIAKQMDRIFEEDMKKSTELTKEIYARRPWIIKLKEPVSRLLSEIL